MTPQPLVHVVREAAGEPEGALILLHGRGADEHDLASVLDILDPERRLVGLTPGAPLPGPGGAGGRWWYMVPRVGYPDPRTFQATYAQLTSFLDGWLAERAIPWQRTLIGGFSMGCVMSYATGLGSGRPSPAGILAMSGFIPSVEGWDAQLDTRAGLPVFITRLARPGHLRRLRSRRAPASRARRARRRVSRARGRPSPRAAQRGAHDRMGRRPPRRVPEVALAAVLAVNGCST